jgi:hypothetical protein
VLAPTFRPSDVYRCLLMGLDRFRAEYGEPSPGLLAAVAERRRRQQQSIPVNRASCVPRGAARRRPDELDAITAASTAVATPTRDASADSTPQGRRVLCG